MKGKKEDPEQSFISKLLSSLSEDTLKRLVFSVIFAVPSIRRPFIRAMLITFLLGMLTALVLVYRVPILDRLSRLLAGDAPLSS